LVPFPKTEAGFAQIYVVGDNNEAKACNRVQKLNPTLNPHTMFQLQQLLSQHNSFAQFHRTVGEVLHQTPAAKFVLKHIQINNVNPKTYNRPTVCEIAMVVDNDCY
jgi:hypothetical protein